VESEFSVSEETSMARRELSIPATELLLVCSCTGEEAGEAHGAEFSGEQSLGSWFAGPNLGDCSPEQKADLSFLWSTLPGSCSCGPLFLAPAPVFHSSWLLLLCSHQQFHADLLFPLCNETPWGGLVPYWSLW
jgi:hypothetical protein